MKRGGSPAALVWTPLSLISVRVPDARLPINQALERYTHLFLAVEQLRNDEPNPVDR